MRDTLILRLTADPDAPAEWLLRAAPGEAATRPDEVGHGPLAEVLSQLAGRRIILLVPSEDVLLTQVSLAVRQSSQLLQAVPYALEEQLAQDIEKLHFALGPRRADGSVPVAVVERAKMDGWLAPFREAGLMPELVLPDLLALGGSDDEKILLVEGNRCLLRSDAFGGFACELDTLPGLLPLLDLSNGISLIRANCDAALPDGISLNRSETVASGIAAMNHAGDSARLNLLQAGYAPRRAVDRWLRAFRLPAAMAATWLALTSFALTLSNHGLSGERDRLLAQAEASFRTAFPAITRIVDMRVQAEQQLRALQGGGQQSGFLRLMSASASALQPLTSLSLEGAQYRDGSLYLSLSGSDLQALDVLKVNFSKSSDLALEVQSAQATSEGVQIRLKVDPIGSAS